MENRQRLIKVNGWPNDMHGKVNIAIHGLIFPIATGLSLIELERAGHDMTDDNYFYLTGYQFTAIVSQLTDGCNIISIYLEHVGNLGPLDIVKIKKEYSEEISL